jgi:hypothetical protein
MMMKNLLKGILIVLAVAATIFTLNLLIESWNHRDLPMNKIFGYIMENEHPWSRTGIFTGAFVFFAGIGYFMDGVGGPGN